MKKKFKTACIKAINDKPNFTTMLLSVVILAIIIFVLGDVNEYCASAAKRYELGDSVASAIVKGIDIDFEEINARQDEIDETIKGLALNTDLGEILAENDLTTDGRVHNNFIVWGIILAALLMIGLILMNIIRMISHIYKVLFKKNEP